MSANFPTSLPVTTNSQTTDTLAAAGHTALHNNLSAEVTAIATKIGPGSSIPVAHTVLHGQSFTSSTWSKVDVSADVTGVLSTANGGNGTTSTDGTGSAVFSNNPTLVSPTLTGGPSLQGGGVWAGGPTINQPTITDFTNSNHDHSNAAGGGLLKNPYKFSAYASVTVTSPGVIVFDSELFDTGNNFNTATGIFTAPVAGFYFFTSNVSWNLAGITAYGLTINKNGVDIKQHSSFTTANAGTWALSISGFLQLAQNDTVSIHSSGTAGANIFGSSDTTYFEGYLVAAT